MAVRAPIAGRSRPTVDAPFDALPRATLVRAFWHWTGDPVDAEDLTQQTLLEVWRSARRPDDPDEERRWTFGVARNVLARWRREHGRRAHYELPENADQLALLGTKSSLDDDLEREELIDLLDHALASLPPASRQALLLRYIDDLPQAEIAARLGISEGALESRLHRGNQALKAHLITNATDDAISLGLLAPDDLWVSTRIWCPDCGTRHLEGRWGDAGYLFLDCPSCALLGGERAVIVRSRTIPPGRHQLPDLNRRSFKAASNRIQRNLHLATAEGMSSRTACDVCGGPVRIERHDGSLFGYPELRFTCQRCDAPRLWSFVPGGTASHPAIQRFLQRHTRIRMIPQPTITHGGRDTFVMSWESVRTGARIVALRDVETLRFRGIFEGDTQVAEDDLRLAHLDVHSFS